MKKLLAILLCLLTVNAQAAYLGSWKIDDLLTFVANTHRFDTGAATDADAVASYRLYEDETATPILTGNMALIDSANTAGFYSEQLTLSAANGFEKGKSYSVYVTATVNSVAGTVGHTFQIEAEVDANLVSDPVTIEDGTGTGQLDTNGGHIVRVTTADNLTNAPTAGDLTATMKTSVRDAILSDATRFQGADISAILADSNELQLDWVNGGRLDLILDARASQASVDVIDGIVDSVLDDTGTSGVVLAADAITNAKVADSAWDELIEELFSFDATLAYSTATAGSLVKEIADNAGGGTPPTAAAIADAVWDETLSGHAGVGSTGEALSAAGSAGDPWITPLPGAYGSGTAGFILGTNLDAAITTRMASYTQPTGFLAATFPGGTIANTTNITAGTVTTVTNLTNAPTAGDFTATMKTSAQTAAAAALTAYDPPTGAELVAEVDAIQVDVATRASQTSVNTVDDLVDDLETRIPNTDISTWATRGLGMIVIDGAVYQYTANALELGPSGSGLDAAATRAALGLASANLDTQLDALPTANENADQAWDEAIAGHLTAGSTGAKLNSAASAGDPWGTAIPGAYAAGTAGYVLGNITATLSASGVSVSSPLAILSQVLTVTIGDEYTVANGLAPTWDLSGAPSLTGTTVEFRAVRPDGGFYTEMATVVDSDTLRIELVAAETGDVTKLATPTTWSYHLRILTPFVLTVVQGSMPVFTTPTP